MTNSAQITPVILAGGNGTRLWPLSRKAYPKQFTELVGDESLFAATARRLSGARFAAPTVLTGADFRFIVAEQLDQVGVEPGAIVIEPTGRNTGPAILAAALAHKDAKDTLLLVSPSDHVVQDEEAFAAALEEGAARAMDGAIVTFGITPTRAETGYGYLNVAADGRVAAFVEKPNAERAAEMLEEGGYLWNAGLFLARVDTLIEAFQNHAPELFIPVEAAMAKATTDLCFTRLGPDAWFKAPDISIDYAVMEKTSGVTAVPLDCGWSDMGSWRSVWEEGNQDPEGNVVSDNATALNCTDTLLRSEDSDIEIVGLGLEGITAIATGDAVLVAKTDSAEEVKTAITALKAKSKKQATDFARCHRPWGYYETLSLGERFQVKRIMVKPGAALSLQSHVHRAEHWVVVEGSAQVTVDDSVKLMSENQSVYIPLGAVHRLENPGKLPLHLIEVQSGCYLGEDDIIRYEDVYARETPVAA